MHYLAIVLQYQNPIIKRLLWDSLLILEKQRRISNFQTHFKSKTASGEFPIRRDRCRVKKSEGESLLSLFLVEGFCIEFWRNLYCHSRYVIQSIWPYDLHESITFNFPSYKSSQEMLIWTHGMECHRKCVNLEIKMHKCYKVV